MKIIIQNKSGCKFETEINLEITFNSKLKINVFKRSDTAI